MIPFPLVEVLVERVGRCIFSNEIEKKRAPSDHGILIEEERRHLNLLQLSR